MAHKSLKAGLLLMLASQLQYRPPVALASPLLLVGKDIPLPLAANEVALYDTITNSTGPLLRPPLPLVVSRRAVADDASDKKVRVPIGPVQPPWMDPRRHGIAAPNNGSLHRCDTNINSPRYEHVMAAADWFAAPKMKDVKCKRDPYNPHSMHFTGSYQEMASLKGVHVYIHGYMGQDRCELVAEQLRQLARRCMWNFPADDGVERVGGAIYYMNVPRTYTWLSVTKEPLDWVAPY